MYLNLFICICVFVFSVYLCICRHIDWIWQSGEYSNNICLFAGRNIKWVGIIFRPSTEMTKQTLFCVRHTFSRTSVNENVGLGKLTMQLVITCLLTRLSGVHPGGQPTSSFVQLDTRFQANAGNWMISDFLTFQTKFA